MNAVNPADVARTALDCIRHGEAESPCVFRSATADWIKAVESLIEQLSDPIPLDERVLPLNERDLSDSLPAAVRSMGKSRPSTILQFNVGGIDAFVVVPDADVFLTMFGANGEPLGRKQFKATKTQRADAEAAAREMDRPNAFEAAEDRWLALPHNGRDDRRSLWWSRR